MVSLNILRDGTTHYSPLSTHQLIHIKQLFHIIDNCGKPLWKKYYYYDGKI